MQGQGSQGVGHKQGLISSVDPEQLRERHLRINALRKRNPLPWFAIANRIGVHNSALSAALRRNARLTRTQRTLLQKTDTYLRRVEREMGIIQ